MALALVPKGSIVVKTVDLQRALTEWDRRYREEPERFQSEAVSLLQGTPESYGAVAGPYLMDILIEVKSK